jgi:flagellar biosynthetic protein FliR
MNALSGLAMGRFLMFTLVFARVGGLMAFAPVFGATSVPPRVRFLIAVALALVIAPVVGDAKVPWPSTFVGIAWLVIGEIAVGLLLGLGMQALFTGVQMGGHAIAQQTGMSLSGVFDPQFGTETTAVGQLYYLLSLAIFLIVGGHRLVMAALIDSFQAVPPAGTGITADAIHVLVALVGQSFSLAARVAAPAVVCLMLAGLAMGIVSRTAPQVNILTVGFAVRTMLGLAAVAVSLFGVALLMREQVPAFIDALRNGLGMD